MAANASGDSRPVPDPTVLTSALVDKAIAALEKVFDTRMVGIDREIAELRAGLAARPVEIEMAVRHLQELHDEKFKTVEEKFAGVQIQFKERDERTTASKTASDTAVAAALQAQKEAAGESAKSFTLSIDKSERATLEQITQQRSQIQSSTTNLDGKIDDLKERVTRIEGAAVGIVSAKTETTQAHTSNTQNIAMIVGIIGAVGVVIALIERFAR
jgi:hypothetical protein